MDQLLQLLKENALETAEDMGKMLNMSAEDVRAKIKDYEDQDIIRGYQAILDEDKLDINQVRAAIEVKVTPERQGGFNQIAQRISRFDEVESLFLMSGTYDLLLFVNGPDLRNVASFVSEKLATMDGVTATATHFMLKTYKSFGVLMEKEDEYERLKVSP
ncbi:MAG: Lrp/AsnC family transcriptional regulator [Spartobacteria bacterium]|nr:Lrp/AsnC family transcriptional regulator [Spartobacteria bacterium]